ncbi:MAG TPA: prenyltransferase/squalene oxidase repeat-containing protein [Fimbriiglobus sp.]|nr:prenyltransferase/squalene oxidase repeat-containing protein [Fimbriiglobus sp.]
MTRRSSLVARRSFLRAGVAFGVGGGLALVGHAQDSPTPTADPDLITADAQSAVDRGLAYLAGAQAADGSFPDTRTMFGNVAITGLAGMAMMAGGHQPGRGKFGGAVARAAEYVADRGASSTPAGYLNNADVLLSHGAMYQHGFGALFLSEVHGMVPDPAKQKRVRGVLEQAVELTLKAQNREGGWRYEPRPNQADVSVTVAQMMALRAARNAGVYVPKSAMDKAVAYVLACQQPDGGFCYIRNQGFAGSAFARSAAAVVGLFCAGVYDSPAVDRGLSYLMKFLPGRGRANVAEARAEHYFYGHYYAALAMWTAGGNYWAEWFPAVRDELVAKSRTAQGGVWTDWHGPAYATAMSCVVLQLPNNYLPIMQK